MEEEFVGSRLGIFCGASSGEPSHSNYVKTLKRKPLLSNML